MGRIGRCTECGVCAEGLRDGRDAVPPAVPGTAWSKRPWPTPPRRRPPPPAAGSEHAEGLFGPTAAGVDRAVSISDVDPAQSGPVPTGLAELDRVLGGGLVPGSVTLLGGEPGVGKSTLLLQVLSAGGRRGPHGVARVGRGVGPTGPAPGRAPRAAAVRAHDPRQRRSVGPARRRARHRPRPRRRGLDPGRGRPGRVGRPGQRGAGPGLHRPRGPPGQGHGAAVVLVGHVTKDGGAAGPRALEHLVDTVVSVEGDRHHALRLLRAVKHRFGPTGEVGLFEMGDAGLVEVGDPGPLLLGDRRPEVPGSAVLPAVQGQRALLVEVQALTAHNAGDAPNRRSAQGVDGGRLALLLAVLEQPGGRRPGPARRLRLGGRRGAGRRARRRPGPRPGPGLVGDRSSPPGRPRGVRRGGAGRRGPPGPRCRPPAGRGGAVGFTRALVPASTPTARRA